MNGFFLPSGATKILSRLHGEGHRAYAVGGCVRDYLRGKTPSDVDIATSALPGEVMDIFPDFRVIGTGLQHGTVTVIADDTPFEVTTFRIDGSYRDGRHPDGVSFTSDLTADLSRRDFTVNAMAYSDGEGVIDPFGGQKDLKNRVIRAVGDPILRFTEDALRILRALRFASTLDFTVEEGTAKAIFAEKERLSLVSAERIRVEFVKLLCGKGALRILSEFSAVIGIFLPEILPCVGFDQKSIYHIYDVYMHTLHTVEETPPDPILRLAAFFHDIGKPTVFTEDTEGHRHFHGHPNVSADITDRVMQRLRFDNATREKVVKAVLRHDTPISPSEKIVRRRLAAWGEECFFRVLALKRADTLAHAPHIVDSRLAELSEIENVARRLIAEGACLSLRTLAVKGADILALGVGEGKDVGRLLDTCLSAVVDGKIPNDREALVRYLQEIK